MTLVDAHVHLPAYSGEGSSLDLALAKRICLVSCTVSASEASANIRARSAGKGYVKCFVGVHPSDATDELPSETLAPFLDSCDGIGEIGLDEKYSATSDGSLQMKAFLDQLRVAEALGRPVQVHSRGSEKRCMEILGTFNLKSVLMHWFEGEDLLDQVVSRGYFVSVGPAVLYSKKVRRIARAVPSEYLLTESDGPVSFGPIGGASGPNLIPSVLFALVSEKGGRFSDLEEMVEENARRFLRVERLI